MLGQMPFNAPLAVGNNTAFLSPVKVGNHHIKKQPIKIAFKISNAQTLHYAFGIKQLKVSISYISASHSYVISSIFLACTQLLHLISMRLFSHFL